MGLFVSRGGSAFAELRGEFVGAPSWDFFRLDEKHGPVFHGDPADRIAVCCQLLFTAQKGVVERNAGKFLHRIKRQGQPRLTPFA